MQHSYDNNNNNNSKNLHTHYPYGTSGFRFNEDIMSHIAYDIGRAIAVLLLKHKNNLGIMITASHNIYSDNGVKIIDSFGNMIGTSDEELLEDLVNHKKDIDQEIELNVDFNNDRKVIILLGNDTRRSCDIIKIKIISGISDVLYRKIFLQIIDIGLVTTPELHYLMPLYADYINSNTLETVIKKSDDRYITNIRDIIYYNKINLSNMVIDCANGVGSSTLKKIFDNSDIDFFTIPPTPTLINTSIISKDEQKLLNNMCGSDYIINSFKEHHDNLLNMRYMESVSNSMKFRKNVLTASCDGDADRVIFYSYDKRNFNVMSGDHLSMLVLKYVIDTIKNLVSLTDEFRYDVCSYHHNQTNKQYMEIFTKNPIRIAIVHTGYSNGGFIRKVDEEILDMKLFMSNFEWSNMVEINRIVTPTGVKNLINEAKKYDIGIYFEQNGHGSVIINDDKNINDFKILKTLFNQIIGDAIMNIVAVSYLLKSTKTSIAQFKNLFKEREFMIVKVHVKDKNIYKTSYEQTELLEPVDIANSITNIMSLDEYISCRVFVRPSGTEDIVRLYVENNSSNSANLKELAKLIEDVLI